jgi:hypothetical protein
MRVTACRDSPEAFNSRLMCDIHHVFSAAWGVTIILLPMFVCPAVLENAGNQEPESNEAIKSWCFRYGFAGSGPAGRPFRRG